MTSKLTRERIEWLNYAATGLAANGTEMVMSPQDVIALTECCLVALDREPVMFCSEETLAAARDGEHLLRTLSSPSGECVIPLYRHAQPAIAPKGELVAWTEKCEITNMQATGLYLRGFPDNTQGRDIPLYTDPQAHWKDRNEEMPDPTSERRVCAYTPSPHVDLQYRLVSASMFKTVCKDATHWHYLTLPEAE